MSNSNASISIIIPTYNDAFYLERSLLSIAAQTVMPDEIIVVDDGSQNDYAEKICSSKKLSKLNIRFFKIDNSGPSGARNFGFKKSNGEYTLFLDADDLLPKKTIQTYLQEVKNLSKNYFGINGIMKNFGRIFNTSNSFIDEKDLNPELIGRKNQLQGQISCYLLRSDYLHSESCFNESLSHYEDFELILRLIKKYKLRTIKDCVLLKRFHRKSLSNKNYRKSFKGTCSFLELSSQNSLLSEEEIISRKKDNFLSFGKQLIFHLNFFEAAKNFSFAFNIERPKGVREVLVNIFSRFILFFISNTYLKSK